MNDSETAELVRALQRGDNSAFERLVDMYQSRIYNLAFGYVKDQEEARDLTQDVFVTVYRSLSSLRDAAKLSAWIYQVALNHCRNRYHRLQRRGFFRSVSMDDPDNYLQLSEGDDPERSMERLDRRQLVRQAIAAMPEAEKEVLLLRDIQGLSYEEVSTILHIPLGTVKSKLNRARLALKDRLQPLFGEEIP